MSVGARCDTVLADIEAQFLRLTGRGLFHFAPWYAEQMRALRGSMGRRFPVAKLEQEYALLEVSRAKKTT